MNIQPRNGAPPSLPQAFVEAFDGLLAGAVSLDFARRALNSALEHDLECAGLIKAMIEEAYDDTRLSDEDYEALNDELVPVLAEDVPTDWSEAVAAQLPFASPLPAPSQDSPAAAGAPEPLYPGTTLRARFVLQAKTASGSMGDVYKALDRRKQELGAADPFVAIKAVSPGFKQYAEGVRILQREAALGQRLVHPHIARVLDFDRDGGHAFLTQEWLEGESLAELLTRLRYRPVATARARQVLEEIGAALTFAHQAGIVHGDVKPGNIYLTATGTAKLLDFGAARCVDAGSYTLTGKTPAYASCDVLAGLAATPQDDVYSLACVAYRMLAGRRAFGRLSASEAERAGKQPARIAQLSGAQWRALRRALSHRRAGRPNSVEDFLREFLPGGHAAHAAAPSHVLPPVIVRIAPRPRLVASAAALVACGVVLAMLLKPPADAPLQAAAPLPSPSAAAAPVTVAANSQPEAAAPRTGATAAADAGPVPQATPPAPPAPIPAANGRPAEKPAAARPEKKFAAKPAPASRKASPGTPTASAARGESLAKPMSPDFRSASGQGPMLPPAGESGPGGAGNAPPAPAEVPLSSLRFTKYVEPTELPGSLGRATAPGWVVVSFHVDPAGKTSSVTVVEANPKGRYEAEAIAAVRRWRFEPPLEAGRPVERQTTVRIRFESK